MFAAAPFFGAVIALGGKVKGTFKDGSEILNAVYELILWRALASVAEKLA